MLVADLSKRYGNLRNGVNDIKNHRWFAGLDWVRMVNKDIDMPYKPTIRSPSDTSNFSTYPDSDTLSPAIRPADDPFIDW
jgi:protein kinase A